MHHLAGLQGYQAPGALFVRELIANGDIGQLLAVSVVAAGGPAGRRIPQANVYATDVAAGATVLSISTGHLLATLARAVGEFRELSAVVALINTETTVIETGQTVPVTAPDQVVLAGRLEDGAVASIAVQGGSAAVTPGFEVRIVGTEATLVVRPATPGGIHITDWAISIAKPDGSAADLPVPGRFSPVPEAVPPGPPRNVAAAYREFARAISYGEPPRRTSPPPSGTTSCLSGSSGRRTPVSARTPTARLGGHERSWRPAHRRMRRSSPAPPG